MTTKNTSLTNAVASKPSMTRLLHAAFFTPQMTFGYRYKPTGEWGLNLLFIDEPGTGKSATIENFASRIISESTNAPIHCEVLAPGESGEGAYGRIPVPENGVINYPAPEYVYNWVKLNDDGTENTDGEAGLLFQDEVNTGGPQIQAAQLGLTHARRIGGRKLPKRVRVFAAMNDIKHAANGMPLAAALANRMCHVPFIAQDEQGWSSGLMGAWDNTEETALINAHDEEQRVLAMWPSAWRAATMLVAGFIQSPMGMLHVMPESEEECSKPTPTRRTVFMATHALASAMVHNLSGPERDALLTGFCGDKWNTAFCTYEETANFPTAEDVLDGKVEFKHSPSALDRTFVIIQSCASLLADLKCEQRATRANKMWSILAGLLDAKAQDLALDAAKSLSKNAVPAATKDAIKVKSALNDFEDSIKAAR